VRECDVLEPRIGGGAENHDPHGRVRDAFLQRMVGVDLDRYGDGVSVLRHYCHMTKAVSSSHSPAKARPAGAKRTVASLDVSQQRVHLVEGTRFKL